jgi:integrase
MARVWIYQDDKQVKKHGEAAASWYVGWYDPEGKKRCQSCGPGAAGKNAAAKLRRKREAELIEGTYQDNRRKSWDDFRSEYEAKVLEAKGVRHRHEALAALDNFERIMRPERMRAVTAGTVAEFVVRRRADRGIKPDSLVSAATVNKDLRYLRAAFKKAHKWKYLPELPDFDFLREPQRLPTYTPPEHFAKLYEACEQARRPTGTPYPPTDWWRALLMTAYMTGWRIGSLLALRRRDLDLDGGFAVSRAEDNKGKRDQKVALHPVVIEHLRKLAGFDEQVFPWPHGRRRLFEEFGLIQEGAGVRPEGGKERYGFHDLRRAFATMNADRLTADALQALMQHKDYQTTQRYINIARQLKPAVADLYVPVVGKAGSA